MHTKTFAADHVFAQNGAFSLFIQPNDDSFAVDRLNNAIDDFTDLFAVKADLIHAFGITDTLLNHLAGCLCGNAAKVFRGSFNDYHIAVLCFRIDLARLFQNDFGTIIDNGIHDFFFSIDHKITAFRIEFCLDMLSCGSRYCLAIGGNHRRFQRFDDGITRKLLLI